MSADDERAAVWRALETINDRVTELHGRIDEDSMPAQLDAIRSRLDQGDGRFGLLEKRTETIEAALAENTALTRSVVASQAQHSELLADIARAQVFARTLGKAVTWIGGSAKRVVVTLGAIAAAALAMWALVEKFLTGRVH